MHKRITFLKINSFTLRVFINLEGCGGGGRELLFQTGPNHPWLVDVSHLRILVCPHLK